MKRLYLITVLLLAGLSVNLRPDLPAAPAAVLRTPPADTVPGLQREPGSAASQDTMDGRESEIQPAATDSTAWEGSLRRRSERAPAARVAAWRPVIIVEY